jgi:general secretion pathway protein A
MYESFFGLKCEAFSVAADPRFIYMSPKHRQARAHLRHGLGRGAGFILLTGEIGAGKTTVCRLFLRQLPPNADVAFVVNPRLDARALLTRVCEDLRIDLPPGSVDLIDIIHGHLLLAHAQGRRTLIVVDEAQALSLDVLEQLRLLTNLDATGSKLQVFLIGQPELRTIIKAPALQALEQRVVARYHLSALSKDETALYIAHRLTVAGLSGPVPFDEEAMRAVYRLTGGVPRRINVLCDQTMVAAETRGTLRIDKELVESVAAEAFDSAIEVSPASAPAEPEVEAPPLPAPQEEASRRPRWLPYAAIAAAALFIGALFGRGHVRIVPAIAAASSPAIPMPEPGSPGMATAAPDVAMQLPPAAAHSPPAAMQAPPMAKPESMTAAPPPAASVGLASVAPAPAPAEHSPATVKDFSATKPLSRPGHLKDVIDAAELDEAAAWRNLARLWNVKLGPGQACATVAQYGLRCYRATGGMAAVRDIDRPAIVRLTTDSGDNVYVVLVGLNENSATFRSGDTELTVPLTELAGRWHGDLATLWRLPPEYRPGTALATDEVLSGWLAQRLAVAGGPASPAVNAGNLTASISAFQVAHGLQPDGLAGPLTLMRLNRESGIEEPRLRDN